MSAERNLVNLESLLELSRKFNESDDIEFVLNSTLLSILGKLLIPKGVAFAISHNEYRAASHKGAVDPAAFGETSDPDEISRVCDSAGLVHRFEVKFRDELFGLICVGNKIGGAAPERDEKEYCKLLTAIAANSIKNQNDFRKIKNEKLHADQTNFILTTILDINRKFRNATDKDEITRIFSLTMMGQLITGKICIGMFGEGKPEVIYSNFSDNGFIDEEHDRTGEHFFKKSLFDKYGCRLYIPVNVSGRDTGFVVLGDKKIGGYTPADIQLAESLSSNYGAALENLRLYEETLEKKRIEAELNYALRIQRRLFPEALPDNEKVRFDGISIPSRSVGGDYYDVMEAGEGRFFFVIADVSGKGMPAALIMSNFQSALRLLCAMGLSLGEAVEKLNAQIYGSTASDVFVTCFIGELDTNTMTLQYVNCGHNTCYLAKADGTLRELPSTATLLGILPFFPFTDTAKEYLGKGDMIFLYTDGVNEARNAAEEEFGNERIEKALVECVSGAGCIEELRRQVVEFSIYENDDITMLTAELK